MCFSFTCNSYRAIQLQLELVEVKCSYLYPGNPGQANGSNSVFSTITSAGGWLDVEYVLQVYLLEIQVYQEDLEVAEESLSNQGGGKCGKLVIHLQLVHLKVIQVELVHTVQLTTAGGGGGGAGAELLLVGPQPGPPGGAGGTLELCSCISTSQVQVMLNTRTKWS